MPNRRNPQAAALEEDLRRRITSGELPPGTLLPSVTELQETWGIRGRGTVQKALGALAEEGLIIQRPGYGGPQTGSRVRSRRRVVRDPDATLLQEHQEALQGGTPGHGLFERATAGLSEGDVTVPVTYRWVPAVEHVADMLAIPPGEVVLARTFTYLVGGTPYQKTISYMPEQLAQQLGLTSPDVEQPGLGILAWLYQAGIYVRRSRRLMWARQPTPDEVRELALPAGTPVVESERVLHHWVTGEPLELSWSLTPGTDTVYESTLMLTPPVDVELTR